MRTIVLLASLAFAAADTTDTLAAMTKDVQAIVAARAATYNCTFSVALKSPFFPGDGTLTWVATPPSALEAGAEEVTDKSNFAWGSITKMWTGASIMQLVAKGVFSLEDKIAPLADAALAAMHASGTAYPHFGFTKLSDLWGAGVDAVTLRDLLAMQSGIPDFDTANPSRHGPDLDPFRATVYANPKTDFLEPELMSEPWVATHNLTSTPGSGFHYSSTNFGILGLVLGHHHATSGGGAMKGYRDFNQSSFLPPALASAAASVQWATSGSPRDHGVVPGFDRTDYNGQSGVITGPGVPVVDVNGVFCGYAASDFVGPPKAVAEIGYALWGKGSTLVPAPFRDLMVPNGTSFMQPGAQFYGLASQNVGMMGITGGSILDPTMERAYGHLGATYGYDSIFGYNPTLDLGIAVASNIETAQQLQPADAFCGVFNRVKNYMRGGKVQTCTYDTSGYYGGKCKCK